MGQGAETMRRRRLDIYKKLAAPIKKNAAASQK
jgi:hypothetical protein